MLVLNPIGKPKDSVFQLAPRPEDLKGKTVLLVRNSQSWWSMGVIVERYKHLLKERCGVKEVIYHLKPSVQQGGSTRPMHKSVLEDFASKVDVVINGLGN